MVPAQQYSQGPQPPDELGTLFDQIANSAVFGSAPIMRTLLVYLWRHRSESVSEYAIAVEALGRPPTFDPKIDAAVRVQIGRLRLKLQRFYEAEGNSSPLKLSIPLGGHELKCVYEAPDTVLLGQEVRPGKSRLLLLGLTFSSVALALLSLFLFVQNRKLKVSAGSAPTLPRFWQTFLAGGKPTNIVLPTPVYFGWQEDRLMVRDREISVYSDWSKSPLLLELAKRWGPPTLDQRYVVAIHMFPAVSLLQYLERHGRRAQVVVSPRLAIDSYRDQNTIIVGGPRNTGRFQAFLDERNFKIVSTNPTLIRNMNPRPGEPLEYGQSAQSNLRVTFPGIIAALPRSQEGTGTLLLIGNNPAALASMLLSVEGLKLVEDQRSLSGRPDAWEMVVQAEMHGETVLNVRPVGFRAVVDGVPK